MTRAVAAALLVAAVSGGSASGAARPQNLSPPRLYGTFAAGRPITVDPGRWTGSPHFQFYWERCTPDISVCKPAPDLGDENATTVRPHGSQGYDLGNRIRVGVTVDAGITFLWAVSPVITASAAPQIRAKGGIDPYNAPRVGMLLYPYFDWGGAPRSVTYRWERCGGARCAAIAGATKVTYRVHAADVGKRLRIVSTATAGGGSASTSLTTKPVVS